MVLVTTADGSRGIEGISYDTLKKGTREASRDLRKKLKDNPDLLAGEASPAPGVSEEAERPGDSLFAESQAWTNASGQKITAAIKMVEGATVHFLMPDGKVIPYQKGDLSEDSQRKIKDIEG